MEAKDQGGLFTAQQPAPREPRVPAVECFHSAQHLRLLHEEPDALHLVRALRQEGVQLVHQHGQPPPRRLQGEHIPRDADSFGIVVDVAEGECQELGVRGGVGDDGTLAVAVRATVSPDATRAVSGFVHLAPSDTELATLDARD